MTATSVPPAGFWPTVEHWSVQIPRHTPHPRPAALADHGVVRLTDAPFAVPDEEFLGLEYMDWKSGGDTNFAPIATADGRLDCRGFWNDGDERPDKHAQLTANAERCPTIATYVESVGANYGRVRTIKLEPQDHAHAMRSFHRDDNNRYNPSTDGWVVRSWLELTDHPDSYMLLMECAPDGTPDPATEMRVPLHRGSRFVVDTQRLWHVVVHNGATPRYALISSFESGPALDRWISSQLP